MIHGQPTSLPRTTGISFARAALAQSTIPSKTTFPLYCSTSFCEGARKYGGYGEGEVGISMPAEMFHTVAYGVYMTVDPVANVAEKKAIEERLREAGFTEQFDPYESYGRRLDEFDDRVRMQE